jgi:hypothetical protein
MFLAEAQWARRVSAKQFDGVREGGIHGAFVVCPESIDCQVETGNIGHYIFLGVVVALVIDTENIHNRIVVFNIVGAVWHDRRPVCGLHFDQRTTDRQPVLIDAACGWIGYL